MLGTDYIHDNNGYSTELSAGLIPWPGEIGHEIFPCHSLSTADLIGQLLLMKY